MSNFTIAITPNEVIECGCKGNLTFLFTRSGETLPSATVDFSVGGTATLGNDYVVLSGANSFTNTTGSVVFQAGVTTATVAIRPLKETVQEGDETVILASLHQPNLAAVGTILDARSLQGTATGEVVAGGRGRDELDGQAGNDTLLGDLENDWLVGGLGADTMTGGGDADMFAFMGRSPRKALAHSTLQQRDFVTDFNVTEGDRFVLDFDNDMVTSEVPDRFFNTGRRRGSLKKALQQVYKDVDLQKKGKQSLGSNEAVLFSLGSRTYLSVNDNQFSFSAQRDLVVEVTGIVLRSGDITTKTLQIDNYFL
jgi:Ca2+-binding RTX toxin-like protein